MTTSTLTYTGPFRRIRLCLPGRTVFAGRGDTVEFTAEEIPHVPAEWAGIREAAATGAPTVGLSVPAGATGILVSDGDGTPDLALVDGAPLGTVEQVVALATSPAKAAALLEQELKGKARKSLVARLTALAGESTTGVVPDVTTGVGPDVTTDITQEGAP